MPAERAYTLYLDLQGRILLFSLEIPGMAGLIGNQFSHRDTFQGHFHTGVIDILFSRLTLREVDPLGILEATLGSTCDHLGLSIQTAEPGSHRTVSVLADQFNDGSSVLYGLVFRLPDDCRSSTDDRICTDSVSRSDTGSDLVCPSIRTTVPMQADGHPGLESSILGRIILGRIIRKFAVRHTTAHLDHPVEFPGHRVEVGGQSIDTVRKLLYCRSSGSGYPGYLCITFAQCLILGTCSKLYIIKVKCNGT